MKCPECNAELINSTSLHFCPACGAKITNTPSKTVAPKLQLKATNPMELSQQDDIQKDNNISELTFDSEKTAAEIKNTIKYSSGDTREELIAKINFSENVLQKMNILENSIRDLEEKEKNINEEMSTIMCKGPDDVMDVIWDCIKGLLIGGVIGLLIGGILFAKVDFWADFSIISGVIIGILIPIVKQCMSISYKKTTMPQELDEYQKALECIRAKIKNTEQKAGEYIFSEEWKKAESFVPRDYFYPAAMEKMKFFLINGHADSMKEAVKLYDEYLHREKLEYEAKRAADEAQRTADMSEATAIAASEASEYAKIIKEQNDSIEFWTRMNTYVTSEVYKTLK